MKQPTDIKNTWQPYSEAGFAIEDEFLKILSAYHPNAKRSEGKFKAYDIICDDPNCVSRHPMGLLQGSPTEIRVPVTWEIKRDFKSDDTGNFAVEIECFGKPSGITASTAHFWVMVDHNHFWIMPTDELRKLISAMKYPKTVKGGDSNESKMVLIHKDEFKNTYLLKIERDAEV